MAEYGNDKWCIGYFYVMLYSTCMTFVLQIGISTPKQKFSDIEHYETHISLCTHFVSVEMVQKY